MDGRRLSISLRADDYPPGRQHLPRVRALVDFLPF